MKHNYNIDNLTKLDFEANFGIDVNYLLDRFLYDAEEYQRTLKKKQRKEKF